MQFFKRLFKIKRYFIVFYTGVVKRQNLSATAAIIAEDGKYLNLSYTEKSISADVENISGISFTNIVEISKKDFNDWCRK